MKFKKMISWLCIAAMCAATGAGCSENPDYNNSSAVQSEAEQTVTEPADESSEDEVESEAEESQTEDPVEESKPDESEPEPEETSGITPAMWRITTDSGVTVTMLGSMHAIYESDYPLPKEIMDSYDNAKIVAVECDTSGTDSITYQAALLKQMYCDPGTSLSDFISAEAYDALSEYLKSYNLDIKVFETYKPWAVSSTIESLPLNYTDLSYDNGPDYLFVDKCKEDGKTLHEIESVDFQMDMLMDLDVKIYDVMFRSYKGMTKEDSVEQLEALHDAWAAGDLDAIEELGEGTETDDLSEEDLELIDEYNKILVKDRNIGMEEDIKEFLEGDEDVFLVVGALHFVGEGGILDLLDKDGITYERIEYSTAE